MWEPKETVIDHRAKVKWQNLTAHCCLLQNLWTSLETSRGTTLHQIYQSICIIPVTCGGCIAFFLFVHRTKEKNLYFSINMSSPIRPFGDRLPADLKAAVNKSKVRQLGGTTCFSKLKSPRYHTASHDPSLCIIKELQHQSLKWREQVPPLIHHAECHWSRKDIHHKRGKLLSFPADGTVPHSLFVF